jgi:hypothetical protein
MPSAASPGSAGILGAVPVWLAIAVAAIAAVAVLWLFAKLFKWALWLALIILLAAGAFVVLRDLMG